MPHGLTEAARQALVGNSAPVESKVAPIFSPEQEAVIREIILDVLDRTGAVKKLCDD